MHVCAFVSLRESVIKIILLGEWGFVHEHISIHAHVNLLSVGKWECVCVCVFSLVSKVPVGLETIRRSCRSSESWFSKCHPINNPW